MRLSVCLLENAADRTTSHIVHWMMSLLRANEELFPFEKYKLFALDGMQLDVYFVLDITEARNFSVGGRTDA